MATVYFEKALLTSPYIVNGKPVEWEPLAGNHGVRALDSEKDKELVAKLNEAISKGVGGVGRITEEVFLAQKKSRPWTPPVAKSWIDEPLKIAGRKINPKPAKSPAPPVNVKEPEVPQRPPDRPDFESFKPSTRKLGKLTEASEI